MPKRSVSSVVRKVKGVLSSHPKSVHQIAEEAGVSWDAAKRALDLLEDLGYAKKRGTRYFKEAFDEDTYFGVYIDPQEKKKAQALLGLVRAIWRKINGTEPGPLFLQKIAVEVAKRHEIDVPIVRYKYGRFIPVKTREDVEYPFPKEVRTAITELVRKFSQKDVADLLEYVYSTYDDQTFLLKERIKNELLRRGITKALEKMLWNFMIELEDKELREYVGRYLGLVQPVIHFEEKDSLKEVFLMAFDALWDYIATKLFYLDYGALYPDVEPTPLVVALGEKRSVLELILNDLRSAVDNIIERRAPRDPELEVFIK